MMIVVFKYQPTHKYTKLQRLLEKTNSLIFKARLVAFYYLL